VGALASRWLSSPVTKIIAGMEKVEQGDLDYVIKKMPESEFERIGTLFNRMTDALKRSMRELAVTVKETESLNRELELAADLQNRAIPKAPPRAEMIEIAAKSNPAREVGGDYYDFLEPDPDKIGLVIADAAGKGFRGSLFMINSRSVFRVISSEEKVPSRVLERTNDFISGDTAMSEGMFITFIYAVFEKSTKRLTYSNAGHYPPFIINGHTRMFRTLTTSGSPLGVTSQEKYPEETVELVEGDIVVMYTDGVIEAMNADHQMFGLDRLEELARTGSDQSAEALLTRIESEIGAFIGKEPLFDDMTLLIFKVK